MKLNLKLIVAAVIVAVFSMFQAVRRYLQVNGIFHSGMMVPQQHQQWQSAVETVAGTKLYISATQPATYDGAGYAGSGMNFELGLIGEITDGGEHGREYALVTHNPIASRGTQKFKGSFNEGSKTLQLGLDNDDIGQVKLIAALASDADFSFKVLYQGGDIDYFQAKVMSFRKAATSVDTIRSASVTLEITTNSAGVGIVSVNV